MASISVDSCRRPVDFPLPDLLRLFWRGDWRSLPGSPGRGRGERGVLMCAVGDAMKKEIYLSYSLLTSEIGSDIFVLQRDKYITIIGGVL